MVSGDDIPVLLVVYKRPETTEKVLEALRQVRPKTLFVAYDTPPAHKPQDHEGVAAVRRVIDGIDWPCERYDHVAETNMGCSGRIRSALYWITSQVEEFIALEDDTVPHPSFFEYARVMLDRYRDDARVALISGSSFLGGWRRGSASYYFSNYGQIWGWAGWRRTLDDYDPDMRRWPAARDGGWLKDVLGDPAGVDAFTHRFDRAFAGELDTWYYPLLLTMWLEGRVAVSPWTNMVSNVGVGAGATHTAETRSYHFVQTQAFDRTIVHPEHMIVDRQADALCLRRRILPEIPAWKRLAKRVIKAGRRLSPLASERQLPARKVNPVAQR